MQDIETEVNKEDPVIDRLRELSALLSEKVETLLELDVGIKEGTDTDDLENEIADVEEYKERVITAKSRAHQVIQRNRESSRPSGTEAQHAVSCIKIQPAKQNNNVLLQTVRACAEGPAGHRSIRCLLDGGSQRRFITPVTAKRNTVKVTLKNVWQKIEIKALETPQVCTAVMKIPELSMLIGGDYYWCIVSGRVERITDALVAVESIFGWSVQGTVKMSIVADAACMQVQVSEDALVSQRLKAFWEIESLGITMKQTENPEEEEALLQFEKTTQYKDGR
ncbi:interferon-induced very large GTPase 1-like protein [Labeo rohita]|uniref:Interferon-induced very large GTPase 1-like protein n=1 Tax=Labeo rohita TaxID=84645 RepID=A0A498N0B0_LABRO|nr:interferon-induced very large GTPase 1-like protein [Labeo rohita]